MLTIDQDFGPLPISFIMRGFRKNIIVTSYQSKMDWVDLNTVSLLLRNFGKINTIYVAPYIIIDQAIGDNWDMHFARASNLTDEEDGLVTYYTEVLKGRFPSQGKAELGVVLTAKAEVFLVAI